MQYLGSWRGGAAAVVFLMSTVIGGCALASGGGTLAKVFTPKMLGSDVAYLETMTGPAQRTEGQFKHYQVDGCEVTVRTGGGHVTALKLTLSHRCGFDLNRFLATGARKFPPVNRMTLGQFDAAQGGRGQFTADCLSLCGNAYDPSVYEYVMGSHADGYRDVMLEIKLVHDDAIDASERWAQAMTQAEGEGWVVNTGFNCTRRYDAMAHKLFRDVRPTAIIIGHDLHPPVAACH